MKQDRSHRGMEDIIKKGWDDKAGPNESPDELLKDAVFALRRDISATRHQFENPDGSVRRADLKGGTGSFKSIEEVNAWHDDLVKKCREQRTLLSDALVHVEHEVLPKMEKPTTQYLNQVGGPYNYVAYLLAREVSKVVASVEQLDDIQRDFMRIFWHVSGWEGFAHDVERRVGRKETKE